MMPDAVGPKPDPQARIIDRLTDDEIFGPVEQPPRPEPADADAQRLQSRSLAEILLDPDALKPPAPVVPSLAWAGRISLVAAREGVGKSTLFAAVAAAVTKGGEFLGERCAQGTVLWVLVEEHQSDLVIRALKFQTAPDALYVLERPAEPLQTLRAEVERLQPTLLIIDTLHRFATRLITDGSTSDQWGPLMTALDGIARQSNAAVLMSAQAIKATGEYRDSSEIGHGVDVVINLVRPDKDQPRRRLEIQKARWLLPDVTLELADDQYRLAGEAPKKLSPSRQKVLDALEPPMSFTEWHEASGTPETTFRRALRYLVDQGLVRQGDEGNYSHSEQPPPPINSHGRHGGGPEEQPPRPRAVGAEVAVRPKDDDVPF